jgi:hypothetical protein
MGTRNQVGSAIMAKDIKEQLGLRTRQLHEIGNTTDVQPFHGDRGSVACYI